MAGQNRKASKHVGVRPMLKSDGELSGFELPEGVLPKGDDWHPMTRQWWDELRSSPQAIQAATGMDWYYLLDTALLHHIYWSNGRWEFANEIRMRLAKFGATPGDRASLKMELEIPEKFSVGEAKPSGVILMDEERKKRLAAGGA